MAIKRSRSISVSDKVQEPGREGPRPFFDGTKSGSKISPLAGGGAASTTTTITKRKTRNTENKRVESLRDQQDKASSVCGATMKNYYTAFLTHEETRIMMLSHFLLSTAPGQQSDLVMRKEEEDTEGEDEAVRVLPRKRQRRNAMNLSVLRGGREPASSSWCQSSLHDSQDSQQDMIVEKLLILQV